MWELCSRAHPVTGAPGSSVSSSKTSPGNSDAIAPCGRGRGNRQRGRLSQRRASPRGADATGHSTLQPDSAPPSLCCEFSFCCYFRECAAVTTPRRASNPHLMRDSLDTGWRKSGTYGHADTRRMGAGQRNSGRSADQRKRASGECQRRVALASANIPPESASSVLSIISSGPTALAASCSGKGGDECICVVLSSSN